MANLVHTLNQTLIGVALAAVLTACGGGGGGHDSAPTPKNATFPIRQAYGTHIDEGVNETINISGTLDGKRFSGTGTYVITPAFDATFEVTDGIGNMVSVDLTFTYDGAEYTSSAGTSYFFDDTYNPVGAIDDEGFYTVVDSFSELPATAHVNESGTIAHSTVYLDSSKTEIVGFTVSSYSIEPDSEDSVILDLIDQYYATDNSLLATNHERYRVTVSGEMALVSVNYFSANGSINEHIVPDTGN